jgi:tetratricopeptide (TPR) repeat protein
MSKLGNIDALVRDLTDLQKMVNVEDLLGTATAEPVPTESRFRQMEEVLEYFRRLSGAGNGSVESLDMLLTLGQTYERFLNLEKAYETYEAAMAQAEGDDALETRALLLRRMGRVLSRWDRWDESLSHLDRALETYRTLGDEGGQAAVMLTRGVVFQQQGQYQAAEEAYEEVLVVARRLDDKRTVAHTINNLAIIATIHGDLDTAIERYQTCLDMYTDDPENPVVAKTYHNLGNTYAIRQEWDQAMASYENGFRLAEQNQQLDVMANIHLSRADTLLDLGDGSMVALCCTRALDICKEIEDRLGEAEAYRLLGRLFSMRRQWSTAESLFQDSIRLTEEISNPLGAAEAWRDLGKMQAGRGLDSQARDSYDKAHAGFTNLGAESDAATVSGLIDELQSA